MSAYRIVNAEERAALHSTFEIPSRAKREKLRPGNFAKLVFEDDHSAGERMWVQITAVSKASDGQIVYSGRLDNEPVRVKAKINDGVVFGPEHIIAIAK